MLILMMEQMQQQPACLLKYITFKHGNSLSYRSLKPSPCFIVKADKGLHTVYVIALSLASGDVTRVPTVGAYFFTLIL